MQSIDVNNDEFESDIKVFLKNAKKRDKNFCKLCAEPLVPYDHTDINMKCVNKKCCQFDIPVCMW